MKTDVEKTETAKIESEKEEAHEKEKYSFERKPERTEKWKAVADYRKWKEESEEEKKNCGEQ